MPGTREPSVSGGTFPFWRLLSGTLVIIFRVGVDHRGVSGAISPCTSQGMATDDLESHGWRGLEPNSII